MALNHGVSLSFYFADPEGHMIEIYWSTGIACIPRHGEPIDLTRSEEEVREAIGGVERTVDAVMKLLSQVDNYEHCGRRPSIPSQRNTDF